MRRSLPTKTGSESRNRQPNSPPISTPQPLHAPNRATAELCPERLSEVSEKIAESAERAATNQIEVWAAEEYGPLVSPGAAARQLCRSLGAANEAPTLKRIIEDMLAKQNRTSFHLSQAVAALRSIKDGYGPNHTSKYAFDAAVYALDIIEGQS